MSLAVRLTISAASAARAAFAGAPAELRAFAGAFDQSCGFDQANQHFGWRFYTETWRRT